MYSMIVYTVGVCMFIDTFDSSRSHVRPVFLLPPPLPIPSSFFPTPLSCQFASLPTCSFMAGSCFLSDFQNTKTNETSRPPFLNVVGLAQCRCTNKYRARYAIRFVERCVRYVESWSDPCANCQLLSLSVIFPFLFFFSLFFQFRFTTTRTADSVRVVG